MAVIYDGIFLLSLMVFSDYPLEELTLFMSLFNPIDLSRIMVLLQLDIAALLGYTGAVFKQYLGTNLGFFIALIILILWVVIPILLIRWRASKKDF